MGDGGGIVAESAGLMVCLAINHSLVDGNRRIALAADDVFLRIKGWRLRRAPVQIHSETMQMNKKVPSAQGRAVMRTDVCTAPPAAQCHDRAVPASSGSAVWTTAQTRPAAT
jgi:hypothetical protein